MFLLRYNYVQTVCSSVHTAQPVTTVNDKQEIVLDVQTHAYILRQKEAVLLD